MAERSERIVEGMTLDEWYAYYLQMATPAIAVELAAFTMGIGGDNIDLGTEPEPPEPEP